MSRRSPAALCSGISTGIAAIVVQFGLAMMPLRASAIDSGLTSDTTSGTSGSMRHADELSMTTAPAAANFGASSLDEVAPAENERDVEARHVGRCGILDGDVGVAPRQGRAGRTGRREVPDLVDRERPLGEDPPHDADPT